MENNSNLNNSGMIRRDRIKKRDELMRQKLGKYNFGASASTPTKNKTNDGDHEINGNNNNLTSSTQKNKNQSKLKKSATKLRRKNKKSRVRNNAGQIVTAPIDTTFVHLDIHHDNDIVIVNHADKAYELAIHSMNQQQQQPKQQQQQQRQQGISVSKLNPFQPCVVTSNASVSNVCKILSSARNDVALVVNAENQLEGIVTDKVIVCVCVLNLVLYIHTYILLLFFNLLLLIYSRI